MDTNSSLISFGLKVDTDFSVLFILRPEVADTDLSYITITIVYYIVQFFDVLVT
jgi:hypothetical protein